MLYATIVWAAVWFVLYPSVPGISGYFHGVLGYSQRAAVDDDVRAVMAQRAGTMDRIKALSFAEIRKDPQLHGGRRAPRGASRSPTTASPAMPPAAAGSRAIPALAAGAWIWGGTLDASSRPSPTASAAAMTKAREQQMPRFGADGVLKPGEIQQVADYVMTLYGDAQPGKDVSAGQKLFAENCAVCHGEAGQGDREKGAPRLASRVHLYGDDRATVVAQITAPRMGVMPAWHTRLDEATIKSLALYVHSLGGGE